MKSKTRILAAAAGALFLSGGAGTALAQEAETTEGKIKCEGVNACAGHGACKTLFNECAGKNSCKGKGFQMLTPEECEKAKAAMGEEEETE